jgi:hypothetical protein
MLRCLFSVVLDFVISFMSTFRLADLLVYLFLAFLLFIGFRVSYILFLVYFIIKIFLES